MNKHIIQAHEGNPDGVIFDWKVVGKFQKPLSRQLAEAIRIDNKPKEESLNSKAEYFKHSTRRIGFIESEDKEQCTFCGRKFTKIENLQTHEVQFHTQSKCHYCEYVAIGSKDMTYHIRDRHTEHEIEM